MFALPYPRFQRTRSSKPLTCITFPHDDKPVICSQNKLTTASQKQTLIFFCFSLDSESHCRRCYAITEHRNPSCLARTTTTTTTMMLMWNGARDLVLDSDDIPFGTGSWFLYAGVSCLLVLFAGIMSGLTLGLMSLNLVDLEILQRSGSPTEKKQAGLFFRNEIKLTNWCLINLIKLGCEINGLMLICTQLRYYLLCKSSTSFWSLCFSAMLVPWRYLILFNLIKFYRFAVCQRIN